MPLTRRERSLIVGLISMITAWMVYALGISPAIERAKTLNRVIPEKQGMLNEFRTKSTQYLALQTALGNLKSEAAFGEKGFKLLAFLESAARECKLARKVVTMKQQVLQRDSDYDEIIGEVKLENIMLEQLVDFLLRTKSSNHFLRINSLYIRKSGTNRNLLDSVIQVSTLKSNKAT